MSDMTHPHVVNLVRRGDPLPKARSTPEDTLALLLDASTARLPLLAEYAREHQPIHGRRWRIDFAWPPLRIAVEVDGLVKSGRGGHQTVDGILADAEKAEALLLDGWLVYRVPAPWIDTRVGNVIDTIARLLEGQMEVTP